MPPGPERTQRRELGWQARVDQLPHVLGSVQVFEQVLSKVAQADIRRQALAHQVSRD
jgi:hypothetical protein